MLLKDINYLLVNKIDFIFIVFIKKTMPCISDPLEISSDKILCYDILSLENKLNNYGIVAVPLNTITKRTKYFE